MKLLKRFASTIFSLTLIAGSASTGVLSQVNTAAAENSVGYYSTINNWNTKINAEKAKFPNGKYWNHKGKTTWDDNTYSSTPCDNNTENCAYCTSTKFRAPYLTNWDVLSNQQSTTKHCDGFAYKLAKDIWGTDAFVRINSSERAYTDPKVGDIVRLQFSVDGTNNKAWHTLFITGISGSNITFADCNSELFDCKIRWDATKYYTNFKREGNRTKGYNSVTVTKTYLKNNCIYYSRPILKGDFDLSGRIDSSDVAYFKSTYLDNGNTSGNDPLHSIPTAIYDVNSDGSITAADYQQIQYYANLSYVDGYIYGTGPYVDYTDRYLVRDNCFIYNNGIYKIETSTTASFIKPFYKSTTSYVINGSVNYNGKSYTVTAIGDNHRQPGYDLEYVQSLVIPNSVKTIKRFAFANSAISRITFNGSTSSLQTIEAEAFYNCRNLTSLDLRYCPQLTLIGNFAFGSCTALRYIDLPYNMTTLKLGTSDTIFDNNKTNTTTLYVNNLKNSLTPASNFQVLDFYGSKDLTYWTNGKLKLYGKLFKVSYRGKNISQKGINIGYLSAPQ
ncbi:leucine-rich repeat protein [Ruminococcus flavefaciens]|uniref:leucine-rich repeat protein n=1 Tax=Ruminococcus flavefaciens TaxID=1265 RepID=UPI00048B3D6F|nr:leucine-rich repeat protein [Ruminococcus flavefaciens]